MTRLQPCGPFVVDLTTMRYHRFGQMAGKMREWLSSKGHIDIVVQSWTPMNITRAAMLAECDGTDEKHLRNYLEYHIHNSIQRGKR